LKRLGLFFFLLFCLSFPAISSPQEPGGISDKINQAFEPLVAFLDRVFFWDPFNALGIDLGARVPLIVLWIILTGIWFTFRMGFINIRGFRHSIDLILGRYNQPDEKGQVTHFQALTTALSATVGLGNIAGVAVAISVGGPGATFWMIVAGFFGMSLKFTECTLGVKYRRFDAHGKVSGGPMYYLREGLRKKGFKTVGKILAVTYALVIIGATMGGNMFQSNQAVAQLTGVVPALQKFSPIFGLVISILVGLVVIGGIRSIGNVTKRIVPFMAFLYISASVIIIIMNIGHVGDVFRIILTSAFDMQSIKGGIIGVLITGYRRGAFSNEAGLGTSSIAHAPARTNEPVNEGIVALMEPFIDTVVICTMTSLVLIFSGLYENPGGLEGTQLTSAAFETVFPWFPYILIAAIFFFAYSTIISWSYYGIQSFDFLIGNRLDARFQRSGWARKSFIMVLLLCVIIGASSELMVVINFLDMMMLTMAFPNILGLFFMASEVRSDLNRYFEKLRNGTIRKVR
jgi:AGCS family alanine or glycine:cation symporter